MEHAAAAAGLLVSSSLLMSAMLHPPSAAPAPPLPTTDGVAMADSSIVSSMTSRWSAESNGDDAPWNEISLFVGRRAVLMRVEKGEEQIIRRKGKLTTGQCLGASAARLQDDAFVSSEKAYCWQLRGHGLVQMVRRHLSTVAIPLLSFSLSLSASFVSSLLVFIISSSRFLFSLSTQREREGWRSFRKTASIRLQINARGKREREEEKKKSLARKDDYFVWDDEGGARFRVGPTPGAGCHGNWSP